MATDEPDDTLDGEPPMAFTIPDSLSATIDGEGPEELLVGRYELKHRLGQGGMGEVFAAFDHALHETIALKRLTPNVSDAKARFAFRREVKLARRVTHQNIARTYDFHSSGDQVFLTMELIDGVSLRDLLRERERLEPVVAVEIALQILDGLRAAHQAGVIHRDLKPDNIVIEKSGRAVITDFGIAILATEGDGSPFAGTPYYVSPEQARGQAVDPRSDIYSFGAMLFELLSGAPPFSGGNAMQIIMARLREPIPALPDDVPREVADIVHQTMQLEPTDRPQTVDAVASALAASVRTDKFRRDVVSFERDPFFGRERELEEIRDSLNVHNQLQVIGVGGVGKTRLCQTFALRFDVVHIFELSNAETEEQVLRVLGDTLGVRSADVASVGKMVETRSELCVFDGCDSDAAVDIVRTLLEIVTTVPVLVTSRRKQSLPGVRDLRLGGLEPDHAHALFEFVARSEALPQGKTADVDVLLERVEYNPLAIQLIVPRLRILSIERMLQRLEADLSVAKSSSEGILPRQRSLDEVLRFSWDLLSVESRKALEQLTIFVGSASMDAVEETLGDRFDFVDVIEELWANCLVDIHDDRVSFSRVVLNFARQNAVDGVDDATRERHAGHYARVFDSQAHVSPNSHDDVVNLRAALDWAIDQGDRTFALQLARPYTKLVGRLGERFESIANAIVALAPDDPVSFLVAGLETAQRDNHETMKHCDDGLRLHPTLEIELELLCLKAQTFRNLGQLLESQEVCKQALERATERPRTRIAARLHKESAIVSSVSGEADDALHGFATSAEIFEELGATYEHGMVLGNLATTFESLGRYDEAILTTHRAVQMTESAGSPTAAALWRGNLGILLRTRGDLEASIAALKKALSVYRHRGFPVTHASILRSAAISLAAHGEIDEAFQAMDRCNGILRHYPSVWVEAEAKSAMAQVYHFDERHESAVACFREAIALTEHLPTYRTAYLCRLGNALRLVGRIDDARDALREARADETYLSKSERAVLCAFEGLVGLNVESNRALAERAMVSLGCGPRSELGMLVAELST